uniref:DUF3368 domain-containing protein n=1 Tax=Ignisphaera aggregans TaxID=334771 RepID=A0A7J3YU78_9CREN
MKKQKSCERRYVFVFDALTIIVLHDIDGIRRRVKVKIIIPQAVKNEFLRSGSQIDIQSNDITEIPTEADVNTIDVPQSLGEGERHAIAIANAISKSGSENVTLVITDDLRARRTCMKMGIKVLGTLGLIEFAKRRGVITKEEALNLLERIPSTSLHITQEVLEEARSKIISQ